MKNKALLKPDERWRTIPAEAQQQILSAVWCSACRQGVPIAAGFTFADSDRLVVIRGKCSVCGGEVARVIEDDIM